MFYERKEEVEKQQIHKVSTIHHYIFFLAKFYYFLDKIKLTYEVEEKMKFLRFFFFFTKFDVILKLDYLLSV